MKTILLLAAAIGLLVVSVTAQETGVPSGKVTHSYVGQVTEMSPAENIIKVAKDAESAPVAFVYSEDTHFVDADGDRADRNTITTTTLVKIDYTLVNNHQQIQRIVVNPRISETPAAPLTPAE